MLNLHVTGNPVPSIAYWRGDVNSVWNGNSGSNTNWATDSTGATDTAQLPGSITTVYFAASNMSTGSLNTTLGTNIGVQGLNFNSTVGPTHPVTIGGANTLSIDTGGINIDFGSGAHTISTAGLTLSSYQTWTNNSTSAFTVSAPISGGPTAILYLSGSGSFMLSGSQHLQWRHVYLLWQQRPALAMPLP